MTLPCYAYKLSFRAVGPNMRMTTKKDIGIARKAIFCVGLLKVTVGCLCFRFQGRFWDFTQLWTVEK